MSVPTYESETNWANFILSWENCETLWGQKCCTLIHTQNEEKYIHWIYLTQYQITTTSLEHHTTVLKNTYI